MFGGQLVRFIAIAVAASTVAGCGGVVRWVGHRQQVGPSSIFEARTRGILTTKCNALENTEKPGEYGLPSDGPHTGGGRYYRSVLLTHCDLVKRFYSPMTDDDDTTVARKRFREGVIISDAQCINWFAQLDGTRRASATARGFTNGLTGLTTVIQGLTGVDSQAIGIVAATGRSGAEGFSTLENNYMLSQSLPSAFESFQAYRSRLADAYYDQVDDRLSADLYLQNYEATCTSTGLQNFLDKAVQAAGRGEAVAAALPAVIRADLDATAVIVGPKIGTIAPITDSDLMFLALLWFVEPQKTAAAKDDAAKAVHQAKMKALKAGVLNRDVETQEGLVPLADLAASDKESIKEAKADLQKSKGYSDLVKRATAAYAAVNAPPAAPAPAAATVAGK